MNAEDEVARLLREYGGTLVRSKTHNVYKFPDGKIFTTPKTPSDHRTWANQLQQLRFLLGITHAKKKSTKRQPKKGVGKPLYRVDPPVVNRRNPLEGFVFPESRHRPYDECLPVAIERVPMTPMWCWMRRLFGYGGES